MPAGIRTTQSIARKALFDTLGQDMEGMTLLDLFAGSGAIGLEAASRGAMNVTLVEKDPRCADIIMQNIGLLSQGKNEARPLPVEVVNTDAFAAIKLFARQNKKYDVIYIDPPFSRGLAKKALKTLGAYDILQPNCVVVIQHEKKEILPDHIGRIVLFRQKKYGSSYLSIYKFED